MTPSAKPSPDIQRRLYALMALMKTADDRLSRGIGTGEFLCVYWPSRGQEAIAAAMGVTLRPDDQLVTTYRGLHDLIGKGVGLEEIYGEMMGRTIGAGRGKGGTMHIAKPEVGVMLSTGIVGAGPPVAVGLAMAARRKGLDRVTVVTSWSSGRSVTPIAAAIASWPRDGQETQRNSPVTMPRDSRSSAVFITAIRA